MKSDNPNQEFFIKTSPMAVLFSSPAQSQKVDTDRGGYGDILSRFRDSNAVRSSESVSNYADEMIRVSRDHARGDASESDVLGVSAIFNAELKSSIERAYLCGVLDEETVDLLDHQQNLLASGLVDLGNKLNDPTISGSLIAREDAVSNFARQAKEQAQSLSEFFIVVKQSVREKMDEDKKRAENVSLSDKAKGYHA